MMLSKLIKIIILLLPASSSGFDYKPLNKMLIAHPSVDIETPETKGFRGNVAEVESYGYKIDYERGREVLYIIPKEILEFSELGFLDSISNFGVIKTEKVWLFEQDKLLSIKTKRRHIDGSYSESVIMTYEYENNGQLSKIILNNKMKGNADDFFGCFKFLLKSNVINSRDCRGDYNMVYTYNDEQKIVLVERKPLKIQKNLLENPLNKDNKTDFIYNDELLSEAITYIENKIVGSVSYTHDENGTVRSKTTKIYRGDIITPKTVCTYDQYGNQDSCIVDQVKPKDFNPIFGEFIPRTATRSEHIQDNDQYGNPLSRESTFYKIESDLSETLLKKEFRTYKYKYYKDKQANKSASS